MLPDLKDFSKNIVFYQNKPLESFFEPCSSTDDSYLNTYFNDGWTGQIHLDLILSQAILMKASDIHLTADLPVSFTIFKDIVKINNFKIPDEDTMTDLITNILSNYQNGLFIKDLDFDFSYTIKLGPFKGRRFRANAGKSFTKNFLVFRVINDKIPLPPELGIDKELISWSKLPSGVWMIGGATGSGKSTTLASLIYNLQLTSKKKIITIEKPIEQIYPKTEGDALIIQRDVGYDTLSFYNGLTAAMRQNPDIILIGEVRNTEEVSELIRAAETGHLAISTIHTNSVPTTLNRIFSLFTAEEQNRLRSTLADTLKGLCNQILIRKIDNSGVFALREILTIDNNIRKLILEGRIDKIKDFMYKEEKLMEFQIIKALQEEKCSFKEALSVAPDKELFEKIIKERNIKVKNQDNFITKNNKDDLLDELDY